MLLLCRDGAAPCQTEIATYIAQVFEQWLHAEVYGMCQLSEMPPILRCFPSERKLLYSFCSRNLKSFFSPENSVLKSRLFFNNICHRSISSHNQSEITISYHFISVFLLNHKIPYINSMQYLQMNLSISYLTLTTFINIIMRNHCAFHEMTMVLLNCGKLARRVFLIIAVFANCLCLVLLAH